MNRTEKVQLCKKILSEVRIRHKEIIPDSWLQKYKAEELDYIISNYGHLVKSVSVIPQKKIPKTIIRRAVQP